MLFRASSCPPPVTAMLSSVFVGGLEHQGPNSRRVFISCTPVIFLIGR